MGKRIAGLLPFWLFIALAIGLAIGRKAHWFEPLFILSLGAAAAAFVFHRKRRFILSDAGLLVCFIALGAIWAMPYYFHSIDEFILGNAEITFKVVTLPQARLNRNTLWAQIKDINGVEVNKKVFVTDYSQSLGYLGSYAVQAKLSKRVYKGNALYAVWIKKDSAVTALPMGVWDRFSQAATKYFMGLFDSALAPQASRFMASAFLGRREVLGAEYQWFIDSGSVHLLAISGQHISLTSAVLFFILQMFGVKFRPALVGSLVFLWLYTVLSGACPSVVRAALMFSVFACGFFLKRKVDPLNSLGWAGIISCLFDPSALFDIGFQLSYLSVLALILGAKLFPLQPPANQLVKFFKLTLRMSLYVAVFIAPVISFYFGRVYLLTVLYNLVLIPFFEAILCLNFILVFFAPVKFIAVSLGAVISILVNGFMWCAKFLAGIPGSFIQFKTAAWLIPAYYALLGAGLWYKSKVAAKNSL